MLSNQLHVRRPEFMKSRQQEKIAQAYARLYADAGLKAQKTLATLENAKGFSPTPPNETSTADIQNELTRAAAHGLVTQIAVAGIEALLIGAAAILDSMEKTNDGRTIYDPEALTRATRLIKCITTVPFVNFIASNQAQSSIKRAVGLIDSMLTIYDNGARAAAIAVSKNVGTLDLDLRALKEARKEVFERKAADAYDAVYRRAASELSCLKHRLSCNPADGPPQSPARGTNMVKRLTSQVARRLMLRAPRLAG